MGVCFLRLRTRACCVGTVKVGEVVGCVVCRTDGNPRGVSIEKGRDDANEFVSVLWDGWWW